MSSSVILAWWVLFMATGSNSKPNSSAKPTISRVLS